MFDGDLQWLDRVEAIMIELHDGVTDTARVVRNIEARGFVFLPTGSVFPGSVSSLVRPRLLKPASPGPDL